MKNIVKFIQEIGELKGKARRGWVLHKFKNPETTAEHIFHLAFLAWIAGRFQNLNTEKLIKMALLHDICEVFAPDLTSYDAKGIEKKGKLTIKDVLKIVPKKGRPQTWQRKKLELIKRKLEEKAMKKILKNLPPQIKKEMELLWQEYREQITPEARLIKQCDKMINLFQGLEYWKKYGKIEKDLWIQRAKEIIDIPFLVKFLRYLEKKYK
jgi:putative hydrolase of HD superfamily